MTGENGSLGGGGAGTGGASTLLGLAEHSGEGPRKSSEQSWGRKPLRAVPGNLGGLRDRKG